jgi:hypothetical protein
MRLIGLVVILTIGLLATPLTAEAQQATGQRHRVGLKATCLIEAE